MCDSKMECKTRYLLISIALSFLTGYIVISNHLISEAGEIPFGTTAESVFSYDHILDTEETMVSERSVSPDIYLGDALPNFSPTKRLNPSSSSTYGVFFTRRNDITHVSPLSLKTSRSFSSGMNEARQYLIRLGRLII